jgi:nucleotide-binding universal stress UspA family protein
VATIVVGIDGSEQSHGALRFAAKEARLRGAKLHLVHAWSVPYTPISTAPFVTMGGLPELERGVAEGGEHILDAAVEAVDLSGIEVEREVTRGDAAHALLKAAAGADMLVVGSRGHGGFVGLLLGSVSHASASHATCPVVVVREEAQQTAS